MNRLETTKALSNEERKQIISLLEEFSKEEIEMALRRLNRNGKIKLN